MKHKLQKSKKHDYAVVIGRFQPLHNGHLELIKRAYELAEKVIVVIGSHKKSRSPKNPFTSKEREDMIAESLQFYLNLSDVEFIKMRDNASDDDWRSELRCKVHRITKNSNNVVLVGHYSDESSEYIKWFNSWTLCEIGKKEEHIHGKEIRDMFFTGKDISKFVPSSVFSFLERFKCTIDFSRLCVYHVNIEFEKAKQENIKKLCKQNDITYYEQNFVTADAMVLCDNHILVIRRGGNVGNGLFALPGGFVNPNESIQHASIRELQEEVDGLGMNAEQLKDCIVTSRQFDSPYRSEAGRRITHAFLFDLGSALDSSLYSVRGTDDAEDAFWIPLSDISDYEASFVEDHYQIIQTLLKYYQKIA